MYYIQESLPNIAEDLKKKKGIEVQVSIGALEKDSGGLSEGITCEIKDKQLKDALQTMLAPQKMDYHVIDGVLLIVTDEERKKNSLPER